MSALPRTLTLLCRFNAGVKLKQAGQSAGDNIADVAGKVGSAVKSRWVVFQEARQQQQQQRPPHETVQERIITAAATTGLLFRKGISETKEKVAVGKVKVEEVYMLFNISTLSCHLVTVVSAVVDFSEFYLLQSFRIIPKKQFNGKKARVPCFISSANLSILHYYQHKDWLNSALNHCQEKME
jgi:hypothetical protein